MTAEALIRRLALRPHPEGGYYRETYRAGETLARKALPPRFTGDRAFSTAIYFLLKRGQMSRLHRIRSDEVWHHYAGGALILHGLTPDGRHLQVRLGSGAARGERPQAVIPAGVWFGGVLAPGEADYALVGCTVAPGFDFADFAMGEAAALEREFPRHRRVIRMLCGGVTTAAAGRAGRPRSPL